MKPFWMVWNVGGYAPTVKHDSESSAVIEAERLASEHKGQRFVVLRATHMRVYDPMVRAAFDGGDTQVVPF
jgi:hypothetical protein